MKIVKITVLDTSLREDLVKKYGNPQLKPCGVLKAGDVFYATNTCPKGMCDCAWRTMNQYVFALSSGVKKFYGDDWTNRDGIAWSPAMTGSAQSPSCWKPPAKKPDHFTKTTNSNKMVSHLLESMRTGCLIRTKA